MEVGQYEDVYGTIKSFKDFEGGGIITLENDKKTKV